MGRKLFTFAAGVCSLLCASILLLWAFSHTCAMEWDRYAGGSYRSILSDSGSIVFTRQPANPAVTTAWRSWTARPGNWGGPHLDREAGTLGFGASAGPGSRPGWRLVFWEPHWWAPYWFGATLTAVLPAIWIWRQLRPALGASIARRWPAVADRPMRRSERLLARASAVCLLLGLATAALWARSFWWSVSLRFGGPARPSVIWSAGGRLIVSAGVSYESGTTGWRWRTHRTYEDNPWEAAIPGVARRMWARGDFGYVEGSYPLPAVPGGPPPARERFRMLVFPTWIPPLLLWLLPAWWFPRRWREVRTRYRAARNVCARCAYDLRGNTSGVCPECGTAVLLAPAA
jgi:hypothetical protein